ncbi:hypothetical protein NQZ68_018054 [Dissostichus eleginoides]|nr:hypothetical protein NQZ68_018054 [Dissostichus eleginoides]
MIVQFRDHSVRDAVNPAVSRLMRSLHFPKVYRNTVNVTQASYQAEENQNITLEWTVSTRRDTSLRSVSTLCFLFTEIRTFVLFHLHQGVESPESQDPHFAGRVQWDKDVLREGRLTLHVSRLRTNDSGFYVCDILVRSEGSNSRRCWLNVTENHPKVDFCPFPQLLSLNQREQQRVNNQRVGETTGSSSQSQQQQQQQQL